MNCRMQAWPLEITLDNKRTGQIATRPETDTVSGTGPNSAVALQQIIHILRPLVRLLLKHGITYPQLAEALKGLFVDIAEHAENNEAGRLTDSRVAVRTGIHRKDIRRLRQSARNLGAQPAQDIRRSLTSVVVTRWLSDPGYCDGVGQPRCLSRDLDAAHGFGALVRSVSKDVHPRTVLSELTRLNLISLEHDSVRLKVDAFVPDADHLQMLEYMGANLHDHAAAAVQNILGTRPAFLEQSIFSDAVYADMVDELAAAARREWSRILKTTVPAVAQHEPGAPSGNPANSNGARRYARIRLGMYFYADETDHGI